MSLNHTHTFYIAGKTFPVTRPGTWCADAFNGSRLTYTRIKVPTYATSSGRSISGSTRVPPPAGAKFNPLLS